LLGDDIQNELFYHLSRDGGEADQPVVPWVLLLVVFEDWSVIGFPAVLRHLFCPPGPFKDDREWLSKDFCQLPQGGRFLEEESLEDFCPLCCIEQVLYTLTGIK